jgi:solute:Na+ symporter, SSS family
MSSSAALVIDGLIIVGYFVGIVWIGLRLGRRDGSLHEFALGGRRVPWWAVMASIVAAETSAATFLGAPGEGYSNLSLAYVQLIIGLIMGRVLVGYFFLGPYYKYNVYTVYDYLDIRFGPLSKGYVSGLFLIMRTLASGTRLFVPSLVIVLAWQLFTTSGSDGGTGVKFSQSAISSVWPYVFAITGLVIVTCIYTAVGGIKAVIWTDVIQATLMFTAALVAVATLLFHIGGDSWNLFNGFRALGDAVPAMTTSKGYFLTGFEQNTVDAWMKSHDLQVMRPIDYVWLILGSQYTLFSAVIAATAANMAQFGTDQDMVQRMLTAETAKKARRSLITAAVMDLPIAAAFTFIGILLYVYYQQDPTFKPASNADVFGSYILNVMPPVIRGFVLAGVFATAMGSLSAALNALATSATNDWYLKYANRGVERHHFDAERSMSSTAHSMSGNATAHAAGEARADADRATVAAARWFTLVFAVLMVLIAVAFAYAKVQNPNLRIIPVVLGIAGFIIGPMLGVFLLGMFSRNRGSDVGNIIAISVGLLITVLMAGWHADAAAWIGGESLTGFATWWKKHVVQIAFTWYALIGASVVVAVGVWFRTPESVIARATRIEADAKAGDERPLEMRGQH